MNETTQASKYYIATVAASVFHAVGLFGILFYDKQFFVHSTPWLLVLMSVLIIWTQSNKNRFFYAFFVGCFFVGLFVEMIGVHTGWLFGFYQYGSAMGYQILKTPLVLGVNWFIIIYCCGTSIRPLIVRITGDPGLIHNNNWSYNILTMLGGSVIALVYDYLMEPVAIALNYWSWSNTGTVPFYNYVSWFIVAAILLGFFQVSKFQKRNKFAVNLLLIQLIFFLVLRINLH